MHVSGSPQPVHRLLFAHAIKTVNLSSASLMATPRALLHECFTNLRSINLSNNSITVLPSEISHLTSLAKLNMARCQLTELPNAISTLQRLIDLDLGHNRYYQSLFSSQFNMIHGKCPCIRIAVLTPSIGALTSLKYLNIMNNNLSSLPESLGNLGALCRLGLKSNALTNLPESFGGLTALVELFLTNNNLLTLPASIGQCSSLVKLQASFNKLTSLPDEVLRLPHAATLVVPSCLPTDWLLAQPRIHPSGSQQAAQCASLHGTSRQTRVGRTGWQPCMPRPTPAHAPHRANRRGRGGQGVVPG